MNISDYLCIREIYKNRDPWEVILELLLENKRLKDEMMVDAVSFRGEPPGEGRYIGEA